MTGTCYFCMKPINGDGGVLATILPGFERTYRCVHCAFCDLRRQPGAEIRARSLISGTEIVLTLGPGGWSASPVDPVFLILPETRGNCFQVHQAFVDEAEFRAYLDEHPDLAKQNPKPLTLEQYVEQFPILLRTS